MCTGVIVWGALAGVGVSAVLTASRTAYDLLRIAGAVYLVYLGVRSMISSRRRGDTEMEDESAPASRRRPAYLTGLLTNLLNPKVGVFYVSVLPQFIPPGAAPLPVSLILATIHAAEGIAWLALIAWGVTRVGVAMSREPIRRWLERITGAVLIALGVRIVLERR